MGYLLRNRGAKAAPQFDLPQTLCCYNTPITVTAHGPHPWVGDFDGDGRPDLLTCVEWSVDPFYSHAAVQMKARPEFRLGAVETPTEVPAPRYSGERGFPVPGRPPIMISPCGGRAAAKER